MVIDPDGLKTPFGTMLDPREIQIAKALIETLSGDFEPEKYQDRYQVALQELMIRAASRKASWSFSKSPAVRHGAK